MSEQRISRSLSRLALLRRNGALCLPLWLNCSLFEHPVFVYQVGFVGLGLTLVPLWSQWRSLECMANAIPPSHESELGSHEL